VGAERVAFVTGAAGGIGAAICQALAASGHRVAASDLDAAAAERVAGTLGGLGLGMDVTDPEGVRAAVERARSTLGPIEILVNCAGWDALVPFVETDEAFQRKVLEINLAGPIRVTRSVLGDMLGAGFGRIVNVASDAGRVGSSLEAIYSGAKGGLIAFTKTIAREVARQGVTANAVCPGPTKTPLLDAIRDASGRGDRVIEAMTRAVPMRRLGRPDDIAPAVAFLASDEAGFITGQTLSISGGLTMA
jgi:2-hydroxycyclohexanecarboxyl-CoA dehydrogenase